MKSPYKVFSKSCTFSTVYFDKIFKRFQKFYYGMQAVLTFHINQLYENNLECYSVTFMYMLHFQMSKISQTLWHLQITDGNANIINKNFKEFILISCMVKNILFNAKIGLVEFKYRPSTFRHILVECQLRALLQLECIRRWTVRFVSGPGKLLTDISSICMFSGEYIPRLNLSFSHLEKK